MAMGAMGIGPAASLRSRGAIGAREPLLVADFRTSSADTSLGNVVTEAVRADLNESNAFTLVPPARVIAAGWEWVGALVLLLPLAAFAVRSARRVHRGALPRTAELALLALLPPLVVFVASLTLARSAFVPRYLIVAAPAWFLLVGLAVDALSVRRATLAAGAFALFTLGAGAAQRARGGEKIPWERIVQHIASAERERGGGAAGVSTPLFVFEGFTALPVAWYLRELGAPRLRLVTAQSLDALDQASRGWVIYREGSFEQPGVPEARVKARSRSVDSGFRERTLSQEIVAFRFGGVTRAVP